MHTPQAPDSAPRVSTIGSLFSGAAGLDLAALQLFPAASIAWHCSPRGARLDRSGRQPNSTCSPSIWSRSRRPGRPRVRCAMDMPTRRRGRRQPPPRPGLRPRLPCPHPQQPHTAATVVLAPQQQSEHRWTASSEGQRLCCPHRVPPTLVEAPTSAAVTAISCCPQLRCNSGQPGANTHQQFAAKKPSLELLPTRPNPTAKATRDFLLHLPSG